MEVRGSRRAKIRPGAAATQQMDGRVFTSRANLSHRNYWEIAGSTFKQPVEHISLRRGWQKSLPSFSGAGSAETVKSVSGCGNKLCQ